MPKEYLFVAFMLAMMADVAGLIGRRPFQLFFLAVMLWFLSLAVFAWWKAAR